MKKYTNTQGICPICQSENLDYDNTNIDEGMIFYDYECRDCHLIGREAYELAFIGHSFEIDNQEIIL